MAVTTVKKDRASTWNIVGADKTWTLAEQTLIDVYRKPAISVAAGNDGNHLLINGAIEATGAGGVGIIDRASGTEVTIGRTAEIRAVTGVSSEGFEATIVNNGLIDAAYRGISGDHDYRLTNAGAIHAETGVYAIEGSTIRNAKSGEIWGGHTGVEYFGGDNKLINDGLITGYVYAIEEGDGNSRIVNRGRVEGDVVLGGGNDIFDNRKGVLQGSVEGGWGNDSYYIARKMTIVENFNEGIDSVYSTVSFMLPDNVENLYLKGKADINGTGSNNDNELWGNSGANELSGWAGNDDLRGGVGDDLLRGGAGADEFWIFRGEGVDTIADFENDVDHIGITNLDYSDVNDLTIRQSAKTGGNVWIELGNGQRIILEGIDKSILDNSDFYFF